MWKIANKNRTPSLRSEYEFVIKKIPISLKLRKFLVSKHDVFIPSPHYDSINGPSILFQLQDVILRKINKLPFKFSKYDTPKIKKIRQECLDNAHLFPPTSLIRSSQREKLRIEIVEKLLNLQPDINKGKNFYFVIGLPGSGKSTLCENIARNKKAFNINHDDIRFELPEFRNNSNFGYVVFDEASELKNKLLARSMEKGYDIVTENIGVSKKEILQIIEKMKNNNYKINLILVTLPVDKAVQRVISRLDETGKFVDPILHFLFKNKPSKNYNSIIKSNPILVARTAVFSSDVPKGCDFKLVKGASDLIKASE